MTKNKDDLFERITSQIKDVLGTISGISQNIERGEFYDALRAMGKLGVEPEKIMKGIGVPVIRDSEGNRMVGQLAITYHRTLTSLRVSPIKDIEVHCCRYFATQVASRIVTALAQHDFFDSQVKGLPVKTLDSHAIIEWIEIGSDGKFDISAENIVFRAHPKPIECPFQDEASPGIDIGTLPYGYFAGHSWHGSNVETIDGSTRIMELECKSCDLGMIALIRGRRISEVKIFRKENDGAICREVE